MLRYGLTKPFYKKKTKNTIHLDSEYGRILFVYMRATSIIIIIKCLAFGLIGRLVG